MATVERAFIGYFNIEDNGGSISDRFELERTRKTEFLIAALNGTQYVRLEGSARSGTIGKVVFEYDPQYLNSRAFMSRELFAKYKSGELVLPEHHRQMNDMIINGIEKREAASKGKLISIDHSYEGFIAYYASSWYTAFTLQMDDGKIVKPADFTCRYDSKRVEDPRGFTWLQGYEGPTVNLFVKVSKKERQARVAAKKETYIDMLGVEVNAGDFVALVVGFEMKVGVVTRFTATGKTAYVKLAEGKEVSAVNGSKMLVINDKTKTNAMLAKLS